MAKEDISSNTEVRDQVKILINDGDPQVLAHFWVQNRNGGAIDANLSFIISESTAQDLEKGRFASSVLSHKPMNL
jgi:hypothetical protein